MHNQFRGSSILEDGNKKMKVDYYLIAETKFFYEDKKPRITYGIEIALNNEEKESVSDITINENRALEILEVLQKNTVLPVHLHNVIEDLL